MKIPFVVEVHSCISNHKYVLVFLHKFGTQQQRASLDKPAVPTTNFSFTSPIVYTLSGCLYVPTQAFVFVSHTLMEASQLPVTNRLVEALYSMHLTAFS